jgi:hypothetical protein
VPAGFKHQPPAMTSSYGYGWSRFESCELDDIVGHNGAIDSYRSELRFSPSRGVGVVVLTNFGNVNVAGIADGLFVELGKTGAMKTREPAPSRALTTAMQGLLGIYETWDEAAFAKLLARPIDPREKDELATYKRLHGKCTGFQPVEIDAPNTGVFAVACERGQFEIALDVNEVNGKGLIQGFIGTSRGVEPPPVFAKAATAVIALHAKWNDKTYAKHLSKGAAAPELKKLVAQFTERHGACKIVRPLHRGFDWGYELSCQTEDVQAFFGTLPGDDTQIVSTQLLPVRGAPKRCN